MKNEIKSDMPFNEYLEVKACHKSALKHTDTAKHLKLFESTPINSDPLRVGKIFHSMLLEGMDIKDIPIYADQEWIAKKDHPDGKSINDQKKEFKETVELYFNNEQEKEEIESMVKAIQENPLAKSLLSGDGIAEASLFWTDPKTGLPCKTRLDWMRSDDVLVEIKSCADPSPEGFGKQIYNLDYQIGAWFNREGFREVFGRDIAGFVFIAIGKKAPHAVGVYSMNAHDFDGGEIKGVPQMIRYKQIKRGLFADYNQNEDGEYEAIPVQTPNWELKLIDDEMGEIDAPMEDSEL